MGRPDSTDWSVFSDPAVGVLVRYPLSTPTGERVDRVVESGPTWRLHLSTVDGGVYVELMLLRDVTPDDEFERHRGSLIQRFGPDAVGGLAAASHRGRPAVTYGFRWAGGERRVLNIPLGKDTWRITTDPRAQLNDAIAATVTLEP